MSSDDSTPILIGGGQVTERDAAPGAAREPLDLMAEAARRAAQDASADAALLARVDAVAVVNLLSWPYANAPRFLAEAIGARPRREVYTTIGGNSPQSLVNATAADIAAGRVGLALLAGAEAMHGLTRARRAGIEPRWRQDACAPPESFGDDRPGTNDAETRSGLFLPTQIYPLFESALRARAGLTHEAHRAALGELMSGFSAVAAANPHAWFRAARTAAEIATPTAQNRVIGFPYPKLMNAVLDVDQGAAVLMTSVARARELGIPRERWVYLWGGADLHDLWFVSERQNYWSSPAIRAAGTAALEMAGIGIADVRHIDLYSCFPCAVQIARAELGIAPDDPRPLTVTGGLAAFGGPGSNYSMHAIATMLDRVRTRPGEVGLVTALGWYLTKHAVGVYAAAPPPRPPGPRWRLPDLAAAQEEIDRAPHPALALEPSGPGAIEAYTVLHGRDGAPEHGAVIGRLADGRRFLARTPGDRALLEDLERREGVGASGLVACAGGAAVFTPR